MAAPSASQSCERQWRSRPRPAPPPPNPVRALRRPEILFVPSSASSVQRKLRRCSRLRSPPVRREVQHRRQGKDGQNLVLKVAKEPGYKEDKGAQDSAIAETPRDVACSTFVSYKAVILWAQDPAERDAKLANEALKKKGHQHVWVIIEIACSSSPDHLIAVRKAYCSMFASSLEEDIGYHFAQQEPLRKLLVHLVSSYRYNGIRVDELMAKSEAARIHDAIIKKQPYHDDVLRILAMRNKSQITSTLHHYKQNYGREIEEDIEGHNSKDVALVLKAVVRCLVSPEIHFSEVIRTSIVGLGTDEDSLTRAIITRSEIDMKQIKEEYKMRYKTTVKDDVIGDTSGYYKDFLLTLIGTTKSLLTWLGTA